MEVQESEINHDKEEKNKDGGDTKNEINNNKHSQTPSRDDRKIFISICIVGITLGLVLQNLNNQRIQKSTEVTETKKYWVYSRDKDVNNRNGLLKHVHLVLERYGYKNSTNTTSWNLLWAHDYPFRSLYPNLHRLKPYQKVNHFPGSGFITNKVDLATTPSKYIPKAYRLPANKEDFLKYAADNPKAMFLEKHNQHRGILLKNVSDIDVTSGDSFVQEYMQNPFLVDGYKFDIGMYVVVTSVNPLRAYYYKDALFRFCPEKYHPFDPKKLDKYVVADDYLPTWEVPSLAFPYTNLGFSMKDAFDIYVRSQGKDPVKMWDEVSNSIAEILLKKEHHIIEALKNYPSSDNFFEMMRFDLVVDEDLNVFLLEANMSPNLSSAHYPPNQLLYEQVLYSLFGITGVGNPVVSTNEESAERKMQSSQKNIAVFGDKCNKDCKTDCASDIVCGLCKHCMNRKLRSSLLKAHTEFLHRGDYRRLFPPAMKQGVHDEENLNNLTEINKLNYLWFQGKCEIDPTWCT